MSSLKENKMGTMPIGRLLLTMALPMALSMLVQALYNVVDSAFVAKISDVNQDALNAVSLAFPVQNIMIGIATGTAVGVNALLSRALGERDADMVNRSALNGVFLAGLGMLLSALFGIFCAELFMRSQTSNEAVIAYGTAYIRIITIAPELPGSDAFIREFKDTVAISLGHSTASYEIAENAFAAGANHVTHLFNAMPPLHHRDPGIIGAAADCPHAMAEIICDGIHIHPSVIRNAFRMFGNDRMILISDVRTRSIRLFVPF